MLVVFLVLFYIELKGDEKMTKEQLIALGATEELATKIADESKKEIEGYVEKSKYSEMEATKKQLEEGNKTLTKQLEEIKKSVGDNAELKKQIEDMQNSNKAKEKEYADSIVKLKLDNAVDLALLGAGSKNNKAVKALLNLEKAVIGEDGKVIGLNEQLETLKKADDSSFLFEVTGKFKGVNPGGKKGQESDFKSMTYSQIEKYLAENPGTKIEDIM